VGASGSSFSAGKSSPGNVFLGQSRSQEDFGDSISHSVRQQLHSGNEFELLLLPGSLWQIKTGPGSALPQAEQE
jgi:hypothetical protein